MRRPDVVSAILARERRDLQGSWRPKPCACSKSVCSPFSSDAATASFAKATAPTRSTSSYQAALPSKSKGMPKPSPKSRTARRSARSRSLRAAAGRQPCAPFVTVSSFGLTRADFDAISSQLFRHLGGGYGDARRTARRRTRRASADETETPTPFALSHGRVPSPSLARRRAQHPAGIS